MYVYKYLSYFQNMKITEKRLAVSSFLLEILHFFSNVRVKSLTLANSI